MAPPDLGDSRAAGFSLLEVLVATALMGVLMVVLLQALAGSLRAQESSRSHSQAVLAAEKVVKEYGDLRSASQGVFQGREGRFAYVVRLEPHFQTPMAQGKGTAVCSLLRVTVTWEERGRTRSLELQTMRTAVVRK
jgi:prepilin-type N-terminal cleavage/methylation domain-containing protein